MAAAAARSGGDVGARSSWAAIAAVGVSLAVLFGPGLIEHARIAADPWRFNDDARQMIWPLLHAAAPGHDAPDYVSNYYLETAPRGFRLLYAASAPFVDARTLSRIVPFVELLVVLYAAMATTWLLAGAAAAWGTGALLLSTHVVLSRLSGGLPRSFAFPLLAMAMLALVRGKPGRLCALTAFAAALYFPAAMLLATTTGVYLVLWPPSWRDAADTWPLRRRLGALALTAAAAAAIVLPAFLGARPYGPQLARPDLAQYPEAGVGGRFSGIDLALPGQLTSIAEMSLAAPLFSRGPAWSEGLREWGQRAARRPLYRDAFWTVVVAGSVVLVAADVRARRLLLLGVCAVCLYALADAFWPLLVLPSRYLVYALPLLTCVAVPASIAALLQRLAPPRARPALTVAAVAGLVIAIGGKGPGNGGINVEIPVAARPLHGFLAALPPDAVVAGWPDATFDNVPYLSGKRVLLSYETHQVFHRGYADEMRRRMLALVAAYFSDDAHRLLLLRDAFGVTHLVVDRTYYGPTRPKYFTPFDAMTASAYRHRAAQPAALQHPDAIVFDDGQHVVVDLRRIHDEHD